MARIVCGSLTTFNLSTHLDAMTADLYGVADYFSTPGYVGSGPQLYLSGSNFFGIGASSPAAKLHSKDSNPEVARFETSNATGGYVSGYTAAAALRGFMGWGTNVFANDAFGLRSAASIPIAIAMGGATPQLKIDTSGNVIIVPQTGAPTLTTNLDMAFQLVSNTSLKVLVRGSDGTTRSATLTLA
ncbi:MAG TPA: hypothetical protein PLL72_06730 [Burkholderiaceae bacterium]|nr:hypothetical protein [Burkholderiaceae bacterium]